MKCSGCGAEVSGFGFCEYCGTKIEKVLNQNGENIVKEEGNWVVAIFKTTENKFMGYDLYTEIETEDFREPSRCLEILQKNIQEHINDVGGLGDDEDFLIEEDYEKDFYFKNLVKKGYTPEFYRIKIDLNPTKNVSKKSHREDEDSIETNAFNQDFDSQEVYAVIKQKGMFYSGEIPGLTFGSVSLAKSREECIEELKQRYNEHKNSMFDKTNKFSLSLIKSKYKDCEIVKIK